MSGQRWRTALVGAALACAGAAAQAAYTEQEALGGDPNDAISIPQDLGTLTNGGLLGRIDDISEQFVTLEVAPGVVVKLRRDAVSAVLPKGTLKAS